MTPDTLINILGIMIAIVIFVLGSTWGVVGFLVNSLKKAITDRLDSFGKSLEDESKKIAQVERSLLELKAELPREYLRREDHIRYSAVIEAKLDGQGESLRNLSLNVQRALDSINKGGTPQ